MYLMNSNTISSRLESLVSQAEEGMERIGTVHYIILDMMHVVTIDLSALKSLKVIYKMSRMTSGRGVHICFANMDTRVLWTMAFAKFQEEIISKERFLPEVHMAVKRCTKHQNDQLVLDGFLNNSGGYSNIGSGNRDPALPDRQTIQVAEHETNLESNGEQINCDRTRSEILTPRQVLGTVGSGMATKRFVCAVRSA